MLTGDDNFADVRLPLSHTANARGMYRIRHIETKRVRNKTESPIHLSAGAPNATAGRARLPGRVNALEWVLFRLTADARSQSCESGCHHAHVTHTRVTSVRPP